LGELDDGRLVGIVCDAGAVALLHRQEGRLVPPAGAGVGTGEGGGHRGARGGGALRAGEDVAEVLARRRDGGGGPAHRRRRNRAGQIALGGTGVDGQSGGHRRGQAVEDLGGGGEGEAAEDGGATLVILLLVLLRGGDVVAVARDVALDDDRLD